MQNVWDSEAINILERILLKIHGIVQGVGFRPFIHKLVREYGLCGFICNTSSGVELELEGEKESLDRFLSDLPGKAPKLALIEQMETVRGLELRGYKNFEIRHSKTEVSRNTLISPDICICEDCLRELFTSEDRRYRYPFINCTNCGPRFTIIRDIPYDRVNTSMGKFPMCPQCNAEYGNIENRRYHAQPDCCPDCGPEVSFSAGETDKNVVFGDDAIRAAREFLRAGRIVAVKGLGGVHLACGIDDPELIRELRRRKHRDEKPFALMCRNTEAAKKICRIRADEEHVLANFHRPIVLLPKREDPECGTRESLQEISDNNYLGIMLPYTPLHYLLFGDDIDILIMTSANLSDTPVIYENGEALEKLRGIADGFLLHNRDIVTRCDDSLCYVLQGKEYFLRRSRGYVPYPVPVESLSGPPDSPSLLACGAEQKASFSLSKGNYVFQSQHIGDLKNMETFEHYTQQISHFERMFDIIPQAVVCDLHPDYLSSGYAAELSKKKEIPLVRVQHHHAHMASCMADNSLSGNVIGLIWDGTGLGTNGTIWGGECLVGGYAAFRRFGSIRPIPLIGGDKAVTEISRIAYVFLKETEKAFPDVLPQLAVFASEKTAQYDRMLVSGLNCPISTGMGRLFDGVAAILGIRETAGYEGQAAILLEACAGSRIKENREYGSPKYYDIDFYHARGETGMEVYTFDWRPMVAGIVSDLRTGCGKSFVAEKFLNTLVEMAVRQCDAARSAFGWNRVVLSGGVFQNMILMSRLPERLRAENFEVFIHHRISCNDEGISLGQLVVANERRKNGEFCGNVSCGSDADNRD